MRAFLARRPFFYEARGPIRFCRQQMPIGKIIALWPMVGRSAPRRPAHRMRWRHALAQRAPERREDLVGMTAAGGHRPRRRLFVAVMTGQIKFLAGRALGIAPPWLVMAEGMGALRPDLIGEPRQLLVARTAPQDQPGTLVAQAGVERGEAVMQPPARRCAHVTMLRRLVVEHIDED